MLSVDTDINGCVGVDVDVDVDIDCTLCIIKLGNQGSKIESVFPSLFYNAEPLKMT